MKKVIEYSNIPNNEYGYTKVGRTLILVVPNKYKRDKKKINQLIRQIKIKLKAA